MEETKVCSKLKTVSEKWFCNYFQAKGYYVTEGADPPDLVLIDPKTNKRIGVEVTDLHRSLEENRHQSLYGLEISAFKQFATEIEPQFPFVQGNSWHVNVRYDEWAVSRRSRKSFKEQVKLILWEIRNNPPISNQVNHKVKSHAEQFSASLSFNRSGIKLDNQFSFSGPVSAAFWVASNLIEQTNHALTSKTAKLQKVLCEFDELWIAFRDEITNGYSESQLREALSKCNHKHPFSYIYLTTNGADFISLEVNCPNYVSQNLCTNTIKKSRS